MQIRWVKPADLLPRRHRCDLTSHHTSPNRHVTSRALLTQLNLLHTMLQNGWHSEIKLLASANAVSVWTGVRQRSEDAVPTTSSANVRADASTYAGEWSW